MLYRKIGNYIKEHLESDSDKILYLPIYYIMFINNMEGETSDIF